MPAKVTLLVSAFIVRDGRMLFMRRGPHRESAPGEWEAVGGRLEQDEHPLDALHREVAEETGLDIEVICIADVFTLRRLGEHVVGISWLCARKGGEVQRSDEHDAHEWIPFANISDFDANQPMKAAMLKSLAEAGLHGGVS